MLWFYERNDESLKLETLYDNDAAEYLVTVQYPDGREYVERFADGDTFRAWLVTFERMLDTQHWTSRGGGPVVLPYGWPDKKPPA